MMTLLLSPLHEDLCSAPGRYAVDVALVAIYDFAVEVTLTHQGHNEEKVGS